MYCPQCGQQQVSDAVRFCSRCGFLLEGVAVVLNSNGQIPARYLQAQTNVPLSPRSKGVRQGAILMLSTALIVPLMAIITINLFEPIAPLFIPLAAVLCFVGGLLRILYALIMEDANPQYPSDANANYSPALLDAPARNAALPPASAQATASWRRPQTAEIYQPPSITENTTRLLDKEDPKTR